MTAKLYEANVIMDLELNRLPWERLTRSLEQTTAAVRKLLWRMELSVSRLEAKYYVTAGMEPGVDIDQLVTWLMTSDDPRLVWMTPSSRARIAAAAIRGWVEHRP